MIPPFKWIHTFLNTPAEWHAFVIGFCEVLCPWRPHYNFVSNCCPSLEGEEHYYMFGRAMGFLALMGFMVAIIKAVIV